jgi:coatomer subunit alpha
MALQQKNLLEVKEILSKGNLCGHSIVSYLKEQGHSEIALFFEQDLKQRFSLAIACGNLQVAFDSAAELKDKECFNKLAQTSMALGNYEITEKCYQITRQFDKLNFFYATTGSLSKLQKMHGVAQSLNDPMLRYNTATLTANVSEKVRVLAENGQVPLAYMTAKSHGLEEFAKTLENTLIESEEFDHERIFREASKFIG